MTSSSIWVIRWLTLVSMILGITMICYGIWMSTKYDDCRKSLRILALVIGGVILIVSFIGFLGSWAKVISLIWLYLLLLFIIMVAILIFTVLMFIVTSNKTGHVVFGLRYKEYHLQDYNSWITKQLNNSEKWEQLKSCLVKPESCAELTKRYKNLNEYKLAELSPIEAGCCRPPSVCGYPAVNASYYDLRNHSLSKNRDCKIYKNRQNIKCYNCDSCKAGVVEKIKSKWKLASIVDVVIFVVLLFIFFVGCCARSNMKWSRRIGY